MLTAILILTIFNTGLIMFFGIGGVGAINAKTIEIGNKIVKHTDESINTATTAIFNMDSLKQKAEMQGEVEV